MAAPKLVRAGVDRRTFTDRCLLRGRVSGVLTLSCEVVKRIDGLDNFLHVGSGAAELAYDKNKIRELVRSSRDIRELIKCLENKPDILRVEHMDVVKYAGEPYIPGTSLKGMVRARLELSFRAVNNIVKACFTRASPSIPAPGSPGWTHFRLWQPATLESRGRMCNLTRGNRACVVCDLLGAPGLISRVYFGNLKHESGRLVKLELEHDGGSEKLIALEPGSRFRGGEVALRGLTEAELGLLLIGLGATDQGRFVLVLMGRSKYRVRKVICSDPPGWEGKEVRFGAVRFNAEELRLLSFEGAAVSVRTLRGRELQEFVMKCVKRALSEFPGLRQAEDPGFSEAEKLKEVLVGGGRP